MVEYQFGKFQFGLFPNYVSSSKGINEDIKAYGLLDASLSYHTKVSRMAFDISFQCRNLLEKGYYVVERRAMPGRNFGVDLVIGWE
ncbi:MAG: TonB-dependent receptor [Saprospiraceae bacterium]|nr:TonB-dependent receptor [Saprospiraceae bacterium]